ncbi:hypothetical protein M011DRAFT_222812 [Sporormia fimetaria CBS 119925]|uniref:Mid2 domain-containing protein n=1 Tax=Sporormia fimetaria CBS 119925 TaxID=1340428 RepID=A0A6A6V0G2_9PLEO|nr:hypothetical protein M011DRAFT_222812 [Sporormia fimetaria CBS 119925]
MRTSQSLRERRSSGQILLLRSGPGQRVLDWSTAVWSSIWTAVMQGQRQLFVLLLRQKCTQIEDQMNICWAPENPLANVPVQKASEAYSSLSSASPQATAWSWDLQNVQAPLNNPSPADEPAEEPVSPPQTSDRQAPTESPDQPSPTSSEDTPDQASDTASPKSDAESESNSDSTAASSSADSRDSSATSLPTGASTTDILSLTRIVDAPVSPTNEDQPVAANSKGGLSGGALAGIVVGAVAGVVMIAAVAFLLWRRKRQPNPYASELDGNAFHGHGGTEVAEKYGYDANDYSHELHCAHPPVEMDGTGQKTAELPSPDVKSGFDATITHMGGYERYKG